MRRSGALCLVLSLSLLWASTGCRHEHLFSPDRPPQVEGGHVVLVEAPGEAPARREVVRLQVGEVAGDGQVYYKPLDEAQEARLREGRPLEGADVLLVEIDTSDVVWSRYGLRGALIGGGIGLLGAALYLALGSAHGEPVNNQRLSVSGAFVGYLGLHGLLWGSLVGLFSEDGRTDHRLDP